MRYFKLLIDLPIIIKRGRVFAFDDETGNVYTVENGAAYDVPLRIGLGGFLNLLRQEGNKFLRELSKEEMVKQTSEGASK